MAATPASLQCGDCGAKNPPSSRFCGNCGHALTTFRPAIPSHDGMANLPHYKPGRRFVWFVGIAGVSYLIVVMGGLAIILQPNPPPCEQPCPTPPPTSPALPPPLQYVSSAYGYSLEYYGQKPVVEDTKTIGWIYKGAWPYGFTAERARGRTARQVVAELQQAKYFDAAMVFQIPAAGLGYNPGYGAVYDLQVRSGTGQTAHARLILIASVKKDLAVEMIAIGLYIAETGGHANPAATPIAHVVPPLVNNVIFPGDPPL